jgi:hypothetical protein
MLVPRWLDITSLLSMSFVVYWLEFPTQGLMNILLLNYIIYIVGHAVALMVETLCYKPEGREFEFR